jgi:hypothetical protein
VTARKSGDRAALKGRTMRGEIDAAGKAGKSDEAPATEAARNSTRERKSCRYALREPTTDGRLNERFCLPARRDKRRRGVDGTQGGGIIRLAERDEAKRPTRSPLSSLPQPLHATSF